MSIKTNLKLRRGELGEDDGHHCWIIKHSYRKNKDWILPDADCKPQLSCLKQFYRAGMLRTQLCFDINSKNGIFNLTNLNCLVNLIYPHTLDQTDTLVLNCLSLGKTIVANVPKDDAVFCLCKVHSWPELLLGRGWSSSVCLNTQKPCI